MTRRSPTSALARGVRRAALALLAVLLVLPPALARPAPDDAPADVTLVPGYRQANKVAIIPIEGVIDAMTETSLERRIREATADGADAIVLELDTPGGRVDVTLDIAYLIKHEAPANTVAWVRPKAYSAGTIIALAAREIVYAPGAHIGDSLPISALGPLPAAERQKIESPLRREVVDSARRRGYDEKLVQAFVSLGVELWLLENVNTGERVFVDRREYETIFGTEPPEKLTPTLPPDLENQPPVLPWYMEWLAERDGPGAPASPEATDEGEGAEEEAPAGAEPRDPAFAQSLPASRPQLTAADRDEWRLLAQVVRNDDVLTLRPKEAIFYGLGTEIIADEAELKAYFGAREIVRYERSWSEAMVRVLMSTPARIVLIVVFIVALFLELAMPGIGVFGATAAVAILLLLGAPALAGLASWWELVLILLGLVLIGVEIFILPGVGIAGFAGAACVLVGLVATFVTGDLATASGQGQLVDGLATVLGAVFFGGAIVWLLSRHVGSIGLFNRLVLQPNHESAGAANATGGVFGVPSDRDVAVAPGDEGLAETDLRPGGRARFGDRTLEVASVSGYVPRGSRVRVTAVGRFRIEVTEVEP